MQSSPFASEYATVFRSAEAILDRLAGDHDEDVVMKLAKYVKFREEKFGGVLFETRSEKVFTLNAPGAAIVREIVAGTPESEIGGRLRMRFADPAGAIGREVQALVSELKTKGLVEE
jgi:2,3-bisphosphoglycerate-independent phosphoglycerate mutase